AVVLLTLSVPKNTVDGVGSASMESHSGKAPMFSFQFHPEAVPYLWGDRANGALMKDRDSLKINHAFSEFVGELFEASNIASPQTSNSSGVHILLRDETE
ncbi:hypothetical protein FOZ60_014575, partial [Perkinsus olseni]